jgi:hypothetical protein
MPPHRSTVPNEQIDSKSVEASIKGCHYWIFAPIPGRVHMRGTGRNYRWLTGLKVKSMMLSGIGAHAVAAAVHLRLLASDVVLFPPDDADEEPALLPSEVLQLSREHLGWRISYRTEIPECSNLTKFSKRLRNKSTIWKSCRRSLLMATGMHRRKTNGFGQRHDKTIRTRSRTQSAFFSVVRLRSNDLSLWFTCRGVVMLVGPTSYSSRGLKPCR